jgi:RimJ/RimL family protein N-acetyltransferase
MPPESSAIPNPSPSTSADQWTTSGPGARYVLTVVMEVDVGWQTARLAVEPIEAATADEVFPLLDDTALHRFTGDAPLGRDELRARYARLASRRSPDGAEIWGNWLLRERDSGLAVGTLQATLPAGGPAAGPALVAWVIGTAAQGRSLASEAASSLVSRLSAEGWRVCADIHPEHAASQGVARHAGLLPTGEVVDGEIRYASR